MAHDAFGLCALRPYSLTFKAAGIVIPGIVDERERESRLQSLFRAMPAWTRHALSLRRRRCRGARHCREAINRTGRTPDDADYRE